MNNSSASQKWLDKALDDLEWTKANIREQVWYGACFTAHQAVEKTLKAYLLKNGVTLRKIHDISALLEECIKVDISFETLRETILPIVDYYVQTRYPDMTEFMNYTEEKAEDALERAEKTAEFVRSKLE